MNASQLLERLRKAESDFKEYVRRGFFKGSRISKEK